MDIMKYQELKVAGLIEIKKVGAGFVYICARFDPSTGKPLDPEIGSIELAKLEAQGAEFSKQLRAIEQLTADCRAL